jgi:hypothetical protein
MREVGGRIVLMDFGAGVRPGGGGGGSARAIGTPLYMAPELFFGADPSVASDLYALGVLLFFLITGDYPLVGESLDDLRSKHAQGLRRRVKEVRPDTPAPFAQVVDRALNSDPLQRFRTAAEMEEAVANTLQLQGHSYETPHLGSLGQRPEPRPQSGLSEEPYGAWQASRRVVMLVVAALIIAIGVLVPWKTVRQRLYPEKATVVLSVDRASLSQGQSIQVHVEISQQSMFPVTKGVLRLQVDPEFLAFPPGAEAALNTEEIAGVVRLPKPFVLFAASNKTGKTEISATLQTMSGTYRAPVVSVNVSPSSARNRPFIEAQGGNGLNVTGEWRIEVGGVLGTMFVQEYANHTVAGTYHLDSMEDGITMKVEGFKDGTTFKVFFERPGNARRLRVDANFKVNPTDTRFVEMTGCAFLIQRDTSITEDSPQSFYAKGSGCSGPRNLRWLARYQCL